MQIKSLLLSSTILLSILSSCKTISTSEATIDRTVTETSYNRRESSSLSVTSPTVNVVDELKRIGYVKMKVVNNKDTFNVKVTENDITLDAVVSEKESTVTVVQKNDIKSQVQVESKPAVSSFGKTLTRILILISFILLLFLIIKLKK